MTDQTEARRRLFEAYQTINAHDREPGAMWQVQASQAHWLAAIHDLLGEQIDMTRNVRDLLDVIDNRLGEPSAAFTVPFERVTWEPLGEDPGEHCSEPDSRRPWTLKMLREHLCREETGQSAPIIEAMEAAIAVIDRHRPLGPDGKHGDRHTATCGCEDVLPEPETVTVTLLDPPGMADTWRIYADDCDDLGCLREVGQMLRRLADALDGEASDD